MLTRSFDQTIHFLGCQILTGAAFNVLFTSWWSNIPINSAWVAVIRIAESYDITHLFISDIPINDSHRESTSEIRC